MIDKFWGGAALISVVAMAWRWLQAAAHWIVGFFIVSVRFESWASTAVRAYCWRKLQLSRFGDLRFTGSFEYVRPTRRTQVVGFETLTSSPRVFWRGWRPLIVSVGTSPQHSSVGSPSFDESILLLRFVRGTFDVDALLLDALSYWNTLDTASRFIVRTAEGMGAAGRHPQGGPPADVMISASGSQGSNLRGCTRPLGWLLHDLGPDVAGAGPALPRMSLSDDAELFASDARRWLESENWYKTRGIAWRRGCLLHGAPGVGKTSLVRAVAHDLGLPLNVMDLASMSNRELRQAWRSALNDAPAIVLLEDLDIVFEGRENRIGADGGGLSFDCLLNVIGGADESSGVFVVATTNDITKLDPAIGVPDDSGISSRPGRFDRIIELTALDDEGRRHMAERILAGSDPLTIERAIVDGAGDTGAQFQERCTRASLELYWQDDARRVAV